MKIYNVGFQNKEGSQDETQLDANNMAELFNLIDSLREEMGIKDIQYIEEALPVEMEIYLDEEKDYFDSVIVDLEDKISDYISDKTGYCHNGFSWEVNGKRIIVKDIDYDTEE